MYTNSTFFIQEDGDNLSAAISSDNQLVISARNEQRKQFFHVWFDPESFTEALKSTSIIEKLIDQAYYDGHRDGYNNAYRNEDARCS